jgi:hypothetical protein
MSGNHPTTNFQLSWKNGDNQEIVYYDVQARFNYGTWKALTTLYWPQVKNDGAYNTYNTLPLGQEGYYQVRIRARTNDNRQSNFSSPIGFTVDLTSPIRSALYYGSADDIPAHQDDPVRYVFSNKKAAFRYQDLSYVLDPETNKVVFNQNEWSGSDGFSSIYGDPERDRVLVARHAIYELIQRNPNNAVAEKMLLDSYFDQAVVEVMVGNQLIDQARISRLRDDGIQKEIALYENAADVYESAYKAFANVFLINRDSAILTKHAANRKDISLRYIRNDGNLVNIASDDALQAGYKEVRLAYSLIGYRINALNASVNLEISQDSTTASIKDDLKVKLISAKKESEMFDTVIRRLFFSVDLKNLPVSTGVSEAISDLEYSLKKLDQTIMSFENDYNTLNLPKKSLIVFHGDNLEADTYDFLMTRHNRNSGSLAVAIQDFERSKVSFGNLKINLDTLQTDYSDRLAVISQQLFNLVGYTIDECNGGDLCTKMDSSAKNGSALSIQEKNIETNYLVIESRSESVKSALEAIEIEIERSGREKGILNAIDQVHLKYDDDQISIKTQINAIRKSIETDRAKSKKKKGLFGAITGFVANTLKNPFGAVGYAVDAWSGAVDSAWQHNIELNAINDSRDIDKLDILSAELAKAERSEVRTLNSDFLDVASQATVRNLWLRVKSAEMDSAIAESNYDIEVERYIGMAMQTRELLRKAEELRANQLERHFANPMHLNQSTADLVNAEASFKVAQEWIFYMLQALEYKWQEKFISSTGKTVNSLFSLRSAEDLARLHDDMVNFDLARRTRSFSRVTDTLSFKKDILKYYDFINADRQCYPHPFPEDEIKIDTILGSPWNECEFIGDGSKLDANLAFLAYVVGSRNKHADDDANAEHWVTLDFSTNQPMRGNLFQGPRYSRSQITGERCLVTGGTYNDKILAMSINLNTQNGSWDNTTSGYLTYAGSSYFRARYSSNDIDSIDRISALANQFWDHAGINPKNEYTNQFQAAISAKINQGPLGTLSQPFYDFKERSVAASNWQLQLKQGDKWGDIFDYSELNDIEIVMNHKYISRNISSTCGAGVARAEFGVQMQRSAPQSLGINESLSENVLFFEEQLYLDSLH